MMHFIILMIIIMLLIAGCSLILLHSKECTSDDLVPIALGAFLAVISIVALVDFCTRYLTN